MQPETLGLRRISFVRIDLTGPAPRAEVAGIGQRRPVTRSIPMALAAELAAGGVRTVVRGAGGAPRPDDDELVEVG